MIGVDSVLTLQDCNCIHLYLVFSPRQHKRLLWHSYAVKNSANQFQRVQRLAFHLKLNHRHTSGPDKQMSIIASCMRRPAAINVLVQHENKNSDQLSVFCYPRTLCVTYKQITILMPLFVCCNVIQGCTMIFTYHQHHINIIYHIINIKLYIKSYQHFSWLHSRWDYDDEKNHCTSASASGLS